MNNTDINKAFYMLKKPELWQKTDEPFWNDEHISKKMLAAHLDAGTDAASRKPEMIERSAKWLAANFPASGRILDLGCGPGLYTKKWSEMGFKVTGMDFSWRSIEYAKEHDEETEYVFKNYLELDYENEFDVATMIYCDYTALVPSDRKTLLQRIFRALKPNGLFIFDVFTEENNKNAVESKSWEYNEYGGFWSPEPHSCVEAVYFYENKTVCVNQYVIFTAEETKEYLIWDSAMNKQSAEKELSENGFALKDVYDDTSGKAYSGKAETMCVIATKK